MSGQEPPDKTSPEANPAGNADQLGDGTLTQTFSELRDAAEASDLASLLSIADAALQQPNSTGSWTNHTDVRRMADLVIKTYSDRAVEQARKIERNRPSLFARAVRVEVERLTKESS